MKIGLSLVIISEVILNYWAIANNTVNEVNTSEKEYLDSISHYINSWIRDDNLPYQQRLIKIDRLLKISDGLYGEICMTSAFINHKKGVLYNNMGYDNIKGSFDSSIYYTKKALDIRLRLNKIDTIDLTSDIINGYSNLGISSSMKGDHANSIKFLIKGLQYSDNYSKKDSIFNRIFRLYTQTARSFEAIGDYDQSINHYVNIINYSIINRSPNEITSINIWKIRAYLGLAGLYAEHLYDPKTSKEILNECQNLIDQCPLYVNEYFLPYINSRKAINYYRLQNYDSALFCFSNHMFEINKGKRNIDVLAACHMNIGLTFNKLHSFDSAEYHLKKAKEFYEESTQLLMLASIYDNYGDLEFNKRKYHKSLEYDNLSMTYMITGFKPNSIFDHPEITDKNISDRMGVLISLSSKAETFLQLYRNELKDKYLRASIENTKLADEVIEMLRSEFKAEASRLSLASYAKPIYEKGIEACYLLYQLQSHDSPLEKAFEYSEKSRAITLLDEVRKSNASAHVDPELIAQEKAFNLKVNYFERQTALQEQDESMKASYNAYDSVLFYRRRRDEVIDKIRSTTPEYYDLIFNQATTSIKQVQGKLKGDESFIEYFLGDSSLYTFAIHKDQIILLKYDRPDSIKSWTDHWVTTIKQKDQAFLVPSNKLYEALVQPLEENGFLSSSIIIVPDDILNLVNYEALVTALPETDRVYWPEFRRLSALMIIK